jgi:hypothetical protein
MLKKYKKNTFKLICLKKNIKNIIKNKQNWIVFTYKLGLASNLSEKIKVPF